MKKLILLFALGLLACDKKEEPPTPTTTGASTAAATASAATTAAATAAAAPTATMAASAIPTPQDYEAAAAKKVTAATIDSQLDEIEKDINASK